MVLIIVIITALVSIMCFNNRDQQDKLIFFPYYMDDPKQWYRFISHGFIHADWPHLIFNMISLYFVGDWAVAVCVHYKGPDIGPFYFIALYLLGMIVAALPSYVKHKHNSYYRSLGASGAVAAVMFFFIMYFPLEKIYWGIPAWLFGIIYLASEYYLDKRQGTGIAHDAHFFGAVFGIIFSIIVHPAVVTDFLELIQGALGQ